MAVDPRISRVGYNERIRVYNKNYANEKLTMEAEVIGIFYAKLTGKQQDSNVLGLVKTIDTTITLETVDSIDIQTDMFIDFKGDIYRVQNVSSEELTSGYRPITKRTIIAKGSDHK